MMYKYVSNTCWESCENAWHIIINFLEKYSVFPQKVGQKLTDRYLNVGVVFYSFISSIGMNLG